MITYLQNTNAIDYLLKEDQPDSRCLIHVVNCQGVMGAGIAKEIKYRVPTAYANYKEEQRCGRLNLGTLSHSEIDEPWVVNIAAQEFYGRDGKKYISYGALAKGLQELSNHLVETDTHTEIVAPYLMGCGFAGGSWDVIEDLLSFHFDKVTVCCLGGSTST